MAKKRTTKKRDARRRTMEQRRAQVSEMYVQRIPQREIAKRLHVSIATIKIDVAAIKDDWAQTYRGNYEALLSEVLAEQDALISTAYEGYRRSQEDAVEVTTESPNSSQESSESSQKSSDSSQKPSPEGKITVKRKGQAGDPSFLGVIERCLRAKKDVLGRLHGDEGTDTAKELAAGYELVLVEIEDRQQVNDVRTLPQFRHQFLGFEEETEVIDVTATPVSNPETETDESSP